MGDKLYTHEVAYQRKRDAADDMFEALARIASLTPFRANAATAHDLHLTVSAIAESALSRARGESC